MISELLEADRNAMQDAIALALPDEKLEPLKKKARDLADSIAEDIEWSLKENLAGNLSYYVREMAERSIKSLLEGNHSEMMRWLSCDRRGYTGRFEEGSHRTIEQQHPIIHGALHENGAVALRRKIVDAHRELLATERLADLEDEVRSLVAQVNKANADKDRMYERARNGEFSR